MKHISMLVPAVFSLLFLTACDTLTDVEIKPHEPLRGDLWCQYKVTGVSGGGAISIGSTLCVICPDRGTLRCPSYAQSSLVPAEGVKYTVELEARDCGSCPRATQDNGWTYELK